MDEEGPVKGKTDLWQYQFGVGVGGKGKTGLCVCGGGGGAGGEGGIGGWRSGYGGKLIWGQNHSGRAGMGLALGKIGLETKSFWNGRVKTTLTQDRYLGARWC